MLMALILILACGAAADNKGVARVPLPANLAGTLDGVPYKIRVPTNWNGTLLVFAHGVQFGPNTAEAAPIAYPPATPTVEEQLLSAGFAIAGSGFANFDKDGVQRTLALTTFFRDAVGNPRRIIIWGNSLGSGIALKLIEKYPAIYDAAIGNCTWDTGTPEQMDSALAFGLAYAAAFAWHDDLWGPVGYPRTGVSASYDVLPVMQQQDGSFPPTASNMGRWEFVRLAMHMSNDAFWGKDPLQPYKFFVLQMWKTTERRAAIDAENGGAVAESFATQYTLSDNDKTYLLTLGVNADVLLAKMKDIANISADVVARRHAAQWGAFSGALQKPVLTMHATFDGLVLTSGESYYKALVQAAGAGDLLLQSYVDTIGHCRFTDQQYMAVVAAMNSWLDTGAKPDATALPASKGFATDYVPDPWIF